MTEMFAPLPAGGQAPAPAESREWVAIMPVPSDAPPMPTAHPKLGKPAKRWRYLDAQRRLLGEVCRFDRPNGGKEIRCLVFAEHKRFGRQWRWLGFPKLRPLYGLDRLAVRQMKARVVVCEGEKAADAAGELLPEYVAITSPGGSKAARHADWSPLAGREVVIWPDADEAGSDYAQDAVEMLAALSPAPKVAIVAPPEGVATGWDAADALAEGWTSARAAELVAAARPAAAGAPRAKRGKGTVVDGLLAFADEIELWHDRERRAYATVPRDGHHENHAIHSRDFRAWVIWRAVETADRAPSGQALDDTCRTFEAIALNRGTSYRTWRRVAEYDGNIYLDLCDDRHRAVEITATAGWRVTDDVPVKFLRSRGAQALPAPEAGESVELLRDFVNVDGDPDFILLLSWLVSALRPVGPFPILAVNGEQGSAKSALARVCGLLVDPNLAQIRSLPTDEHNLIVAATNSWVLNFDNISPSKAADRLSDPICRLSTGGGNVTRQLHTDNEEVFFYGSRPQILNGIGDLTMRPDLADRALTLTLPPLPGEKRRAESEFWAGFEASRPAILGALLDAVAAGLRHLPETRLANPPRMADFAQWAVACSPGFGWEPADFLDAYAENRRETLAGAADASPLVPVIEALLALGGLGLEGFDGTSSELLVKLRLQCSDTAQAQRWFPKNAAQMGSRLRRDAPLLKSRGIEVTPHKEGKGRDRLVRIKCDSETRLESLRARLAGKKPGDDGC